MMRFNKKLLPITAAVISFASTAVFAGADLCHRGSCGKITSLAISDSHFTIWYTNPGVVDDVCRIAEVSSDSYVSMTRSTVDDKTFDRAYSMALAAFHSQKTITRMKAIDDYPVNTPFDDWRPACNSLVYLELER